MKPKHLEDMNLRELHKLHKHMQSSLEQYAVLGNLNMLCALQQEAEKVQELMQQKAQRGVLMREFTIKECKKYDGCIDFDDGSKPWIGLWNQLEILVDADGLWVYWDDTELIKGYGVSKQLGIEFGDFILSKLQSLSVEAAMDYLGVEEDDE